MRQLIRVAIAIFTAMAIALTHSLAIAQTPVAEVRIQPQTIIGQAGFFRIGQSAQGRWWFLDPQDRPFFYRGVTSVNPRYPSPYAQWVTQHYGEDIQAFRQATFERLQNWNFNALGAWTGEELWEQGMPYTVLLNFVRAGNPIRQDGIWLPDVFDPQWVSGIDAKAREVAGKLANSKQLIGYFTDNELSWAQLETPDRTVDSSLLLDPNLNPSLLQWFLSLETDRPGYQAAWEFALARHQQNLAQLSTDWQVELASPESLKQLTSRGVAIVSPGYLADQAAFSALFAQRYFELTAAAIHRYDRHHLILGCRFGAPPSREIFQAMRHPWVDVVSANNYRYEMFDRMDIYYQNTHLPVLNSEFSWVYGHFTGRPLPEEPETERSATQRMLEHGEQALQRAFQHPALIGYTWYRWVDLPESSPPANYGLVTLQNEPKREQTDVLTCLNSSAEAIAIGRITTANCWRGNEGS